MVASSSSPTSKEPDTTANNADEASNSVKDTADEEVVQDIEQPGVLHSVDNRID